MRRVRHRWGGLFTVCQLCGHGGGIHRKVSEDSERRWRCCRWPCHCVGPRGCLVKAPGGAVREPFSRKL